MIKLDGVPKIGTLKEDGKTVLDTFAETFMEANALDGVNTTVMQTRSLSRPDPLRKLGSIAVWLRSRGAAEHFLSFGSAMLGAVGVFCSKYEARNATHPCFNCGDYRHKQASCKKAKRCAICSECHDWRACKHKGAPKCRTCSGAHRAVDVECPHHPRHRSHARRARPPPSPEAEMVDCEHGPIEC